MTKEKLFEFAARKGWDKILEVAHNIHSLPEIAAKLNKKESTLTLELRAMQSMGLLDLTRKAGGGCLYIPNFWGIRFMQEQNAKKRLTYSCLLCGTTTGMPHVCPVFDARFR